MPTYNVQADLTTGDLHVVSKDGQRYRLDELEAAEVGALRGEPAALALVRSVDLSVEDGRVLDRVEVLEVAARTIEPARIGAIVLPIHVSEIDRRREVPRRAYREQTKPP